MACALGRSHEEVAEFYGIQKTTVNKHLDRMKKRLGIPNCPSSTTLLVAECWRKGYLTTRL
jgi:DNA-binding CsgD family transcriptional regulator